jgi:AhpD family alkylhydroperoxidase
VPGNAESFYESWPSRMSAAKARAPEAGRAFGPFFQALMKDSAAEGGLAARDKELIALAVGVAVRCEACIYTHAEKCLTLGATPRQVMDAAAVAVMMGGGPAYTYLPVVAEALAHLEKPHPAEG